uniref:Rho GDP dissociation inhibitor (GDI) gamma n=1 Tax=Scophthalmus maximus TaxID=52904 RepID=A0A8D3A629_SCOMX
MKKTKQLIFFSILAFKFFSFFITELYFTKRLAEKEVQKAGCFYCLLPPHPPSHHPLSLSLSLAHTSSSHPHPRIPSPPLRHCLSHTGPSPLPPVTPSTTFLFPLGWRCSPDPAFFPVQDFCGCATVQLVPALLLCCYLWRFPGFLVHLLPSSAQSATPQRGTMLGLDVCEVGGQVLELLWLTMCYRGLMADKKDLPIEEEEDERNLNYNPPAQKSLQEIQELDKDDESLVKYKQTLLGTGLGTADPYGPNVCVTRMTLLCDQAPGPITMDLTGDQCTLKEKSFTLQEGAKYRVKIHFKVNREIVAGLKYHHLTYRKGIKVDKVWYMVGSYGPRAEEFEFVGPVDEAPRGMLSRGPYQIRSNFIDDDKNVYLAWEWNLEIKKDWSD